MRTLDWSRMVVLALPLLCSACGQSPAAEPAISAPATAELSAQLLTPGSNTLQYERALFSGNGWGPIERNRSNGEQAAGDGRPLTLRGKVYAQGFGTHAGSELRFDLQSNPGVRCTRFTATVGVDDEVGPRGSVKFQVFLDGALAYESGTLTGASAALPLSLDTTGRRELRLVATDAGDGIAYDHADWADPALACQAAPPTQAVQHLKYVVVDRAIKVYDIDQNHRLVRTISVPAMYGIRGVAASAVTDRLYVPYWGDRGDAKYAGQPSFGYLLSLDLKTDRVVWTRRYSPSVDSLAITPDGKKLYMPSGEDHGSDFWFVLDGLSGNELARFPVFTNAHNTIVGASGKRVYLASISSNFLYVADTATNKVVGKIGPFSASGANSGVRPFTVNHAETLAFVNLDHFSGFEVGDLLTGKRLYSVPVQGFPWTDPAWPVTQSHGVALSPDETEVWVSDASNRSVHVFDVSGLPTKAPVQMADIDVRDPADAANLPKWINFTRDGRFAQISTGAIVDTATRKIVTRLDNTRYFLQIDFQSSDIQGNDAVQAYSRYGVGYKGDVPGR